MAQQIRRGFKLSMYFSLTMQMLGCFLLAMVMLYSCQLLMLVFTVSTDEKVYFDNLGTLTIV
jgi:hypothetical protein